MPQSAAHTHAHTRTSTLCKSMKHCFNLTCTCWSSILSATCDCEHILQTNSVCCMIITYIGTLHRGLSHTPADLQHDSGRWCSSAVLHHPALLHPAGGLLPPWHTHPAPVCTAHTSVCLKDRKTLNKFLLTVCFPVNQGINSSFVHFGPRQLIYNLEHPTEGHM